MDVTKGAEMSREEIKAARQAKKAAKKSKENKKPEQKEEKANVPKEKAQEQAQPKPAVVKEPVQKAPVEKIVEAASTEKAVVQQKSSKELKEERRLKQEAQRAAKAQKAEQAKAPKEKEAPAKPVKSVTENVNKPAKPMLTGLARTIAAMARECARIDCNRDGVHPAFLQLEARMQSRLLEGSTARVVGLMRALRSVINDYKVPENVAITRDLVEHVEKQVAYLRGRRLMSVALDHAIKSLRLNTFAYDVSEQDAKVTVNAAIDAYINKIEQDMQSVALNLAHKVKDGALLAVYSYSCLIMNALKQLFKTGKYFRVVVVGSTTHNGGMTMLSQLSDLGVQCTYLLINQVNFIMPKVQLVLLGAESMLANCSMVGPAGSAQIACVANSQGVPVYACCETSKFSYDSHQGSFFKQNELEPEFLAPQMKNTPYLSQCSLRCDVVPERFISAIITEVTILPCSSVPDVLHSPSSDTVLKSRTA
ncbi:translation initiation factor eIF2B subunit delta isoform X2 [Cloeon dipterum]